MNNNIVANLNRVKASINPSCTLIAVSKTKPSSNIAACYEAGHLDFGENKVQELAKKASELPKDIRWHMIGHLQRNKVKYIAPFVHLIHGVDSYRLLAEINKRAKNEQRTIACLLQVYIASEDTKFGFDEAEILDMLSSKEFNDLSHVKISGLMGMASNTSDKQKIRQEFNGLKRLYDKLQHKTHPLLNIEILSMGMSGDYQLAIEEGSNMVRIGSAIFGARN